MVVCHWVHVCSALGVDEGRRGSVDEEENGRLREEEVCTSSPASRVSSPVVLSPCAVKSSVVG